MMAGSPKSAEKIREYLARLSPQARSHLLTEIERMQLYGEDIAGAALILTELRAEFRKGGETSHRIGNPARHFFKPLEDLFVDRPSEHANAGQISRGALSPIWEWINHDLLPAMAREYGEAIKEALIGSNSQQASQLASAFQTKVVTSLQGVLASEEGVKSVEHGLAQYTSSHAATNDLRKILSALRIRNAIVALGAALPPKIDHFDGEAFAKVQALLDAFVAKHPEGLPFALTMVTKRLKRPCELAQLAIRASFSHSADHIAATRYAPAVSMVLDHLEERHWLLKLALRSSRVEGAKDILADIYDADHRLREWISGFDKSDWGKRLDAFMATLSNELEAEFHTLPEGTHHVLASVAHRRHSGLLHYLSQVGREALAGGAAYYEKLVGTDHKQAG